MLNFLIFCLICSFYLYHLQKLKKKIDFHFFVAVIIVEAHCKHVAQTAKSFLRLWQAEDSFTKWCKDRLLSLRLLWPIDLDRSKIWAWNDESLDEEYFHVLRRLWRDAQVI